MLKTAISRIAGIAPRLLASCNNATPINQSIRFMSTSFSGRFAWKPMKMLTGLNRPHRVYIPGEEDLDNMLDEETMIWRHQKSLYKLAYRGPKKERKRWKNPIDNKPQIRGMVLKTLIKKPRKPNSANRKCALVRLSNGKEKVAFIPGIGHNLQEHSRVLIKYHPVNDVPGLKIRILRGVLDCSPVGKPRKT